MRDITQRLYEGCDDVIRGVLRREMTGASMRAAVVKREEHDLFVAAIRNYRTWGRAIRTAGLNVEVVSCRRTWTVQRVIHTIHELDLQGVALNCRSVRNLDQRVTQAARKLLGSWDNALQAAGYDPMSIRRIRRPWTRPEIIAAIQAHTAAGGRLTQNEMHPISAAFAAVRLFGSFDAAMRKAGVRHLAPKHQRWSRAVIVKAIHARTQAGEPVNCAAVIQSKSCLYDAARHYFDGWPGALRAAGLDPLQVRRKRLPWTAEDVLAELRHRAKSSLPAAAISYVRPQSLVRACITFFGSLEAAAAAARVDPARICNCWRTRNYRRRRKTRG